MFNFRKSKKKQMTFEPGVRESHPVRRQVSVQHNTMEPDNIYKTAGQNFPVVPELKLNISIKKQIGILDELGFGSLIESKAEDSIEDAKLLKRRFSIGITDFWTGQDREKFLREKGYLDAYKKIKEETIKTEIRGTVSTRKAGLPYIMDSNAKRRSSVCIEERSPYLTSRVVKKNTEYPQFSTRISDKESDGIDPYQMLIGKCDDLAKDTVKLKQKTEMLKVKLREEFLEPKKKTKISKNDKKRINSIVNSLSV